MKKILFFICMFATVSAFAQKKADQYTVGDNPYNVSVKNQTIYIDCPSIDNNKVTILLTKEKADEFIVSLQTMDARLAQQTQAAKATNTIRTYENLDINIPFTQVQFQKEGITYIARVFPYVKFEAIPFADDSGASYTIAIMATDLGDQNNSDIRVRGLSIPFQSSEEINTLIKAVKEAQRNI